MGRFTFDTFVVEASGREDAELIFVSDLISVLSLIALRIQTDGRGELFQL